MITSLPKNRTTLFIAATVILAIIYVIALIFFKLNPPIPRLITSSPTDQAKNVALATIPAFEFDKSIDLADVAVISSPKTSWTLTQTKSTTIIASHSPDFQPATEYTLSLTWKNKPLTSLVFTTLKSQVDPLLLQSMKDELARDYPLARFTPYKTNNYRVVYSAPMTFEISLKNANLKSSEAIDEVKAWVTRNGGDVSTHKFTVITE